MTAPSGATGRRSSRTKIGLASLMSVAAAILAIVSAVSPWWYVRVTSPGTSSAAYYYPGTEISATGGGGGGMTSYVAAHVPSVGDLYATVLAGTILLILLCGAVAVRGVAAVAGRASTARVRRWTRLALLSAILLSLFLALAVPLAQPVLYRVDNPMGSCTALDPSGACSAFWGTSSGPGGIGSTWGAGFGWWSDAAAVMLLGIAFALGVSAARPVLRPRADAGPTGVGRAAPFGQAELQHLAELKWLSDEGQVSRATFLEAKQRLLDAAPPAGSPGPGPATPLPAEELALLKSLRDSGALTEEEYARLERRALLWI